MLTKIACKTVGVAGMGAALYSAFENAKLSSRQCASYTTGKYLERAYDASRTTDHVDILENKVASKTFQLRTNNPLPKLWGKLKGGVNGTISSFGNNLPLILCSAFALLSKGFMAKAGAIGAALIALYSVARQGFGLGKETTMR